MRRFCIALPAIFHSPAVRPPVLEEMQSDIDVTIAGLARRYSDQTCMALQFEELVAEGNLKLAKLIDRGELERQPTRLNFFKYLKTAVANHFRSLVQRHRFTHKRTGTAPPPRQARSVEPEAEPPVEHHKNVELSLDDDEHVVQVASGADMDAAEREIVDDCRQLLTPVELLVFNELLKPGEATRFAAEIDAYIGKEVGKPLIVNIRQEHHAYGLGLSTPLFREAVLSVRQKIRDYQTMTTEAMSEDLRKKVIIQQLASLLDIHVPPNQPETVIRRLFTIAARDQHEKITPQTAELLKEIGAKPPKAYGSALACYGVLYQRNNPHCVKCGLRPSCATEAANYGLTKIALSPRLLGVKNIRIPAILPEAPSASSVDTSEPNTGNEMEVVAHLSHHFTRVNRGDDVFFTLKNDADRRLLFCLEETSPVRIRFCDPSEGLKLLLVGRRKNWCSPPGISPDQLISLIDRHASEAIN